MPRVRRISNDHVVNVNCTDPLGRTPLHLAVANEQKEVVQFLLTKVDLRAVYQALMLAINFGHDEIAEMIIGERSQRVRDITISNTLTRQAPISILTKVNFCKTSCCETDLTLLN